MNMIYGWKNSLNRRGHFPEITKLGINGGLNKVILPSGTNKYRWKGFFKLLSAPQTLPINKQHTIYSSTTQSYKDALHKIKDPLDQQATPRCSTEVVSPNSTPSLSNKFAAFYPEKICHHP